MHTRKRAGVEHVQRLESRRLLSFASVGSTMPVNLPQPAHPALFDLAVAGDGTYLIASASVSGTTALISAARYSAAGRQIGGALMIDSFATNPEAQSPGVSVSADSDGDAVVAYTGLAGDAFNVRFSRI